MTQDVLKDMLRSYDKRTTIDEIQKKVAEHFNISVKEMQSSRRARTVARPRPDCDVSGQTADFTFAAGNRTQI